MIGTLIVLGSMAFGVAFVVAWLLLPGVRTWVEAPKHRFQANVRRYDRSAAGNREQGVQQAYVVSGVSRTGKRT